MADGTIIIQAEDMNLDDFKVVDGANASGGELVKITDYDGSLKTDFTGDSGVYDFTISVQDENDGASTLYIVIDGETVGTITLDENNDGGGYDHGGFTDITIEGLEIPAGAEIKIVADQNCGEFVRIDKIELDPVEVDDPEPVGDEICLLEETFDNSNLESSGNVVSSGFKGEGGIATTNGWYDGALEFAEVDFTGLTHGTITFDAGVIYGDFESSGTYRDFFSVELVLEDGTVILLDTFKGDGSTLIGSETGQKLDHGLEQLTYDVPEGIGAAKLQFRSMISADCEKIGIDNVVIKAKAPPIDPQSLEAFDNCYEINESDIIGVNSGQFMANLLLDEDDANGTAENDGVGNVDTSSNGQPLTVVSAGGVDAGVPFEVEVTVGGQTLTETVTVNADGSVVFDPSPELEAALADGEHVEFSFEYTITDGTTQTIIDPSTAGERRVVTFDEPGQDGGDFLSDLDIDGVTISATRRNDLGDSNPENAARLYDTSVSGRDNDLQASVSGDLTNVLIIQEDNGSDLTPDDQFNGGIISFKFDQPSTIFSVDVIDTEESNGVAPLFTFIFADGSTQEVSAIVTGDTDAAMQTFNGGQGFSDVVEVL
ncbi:MAG: hypothetical protein AAGA26_01040, partial [Pseudomonadota bacterium]